MEVTGQLHVPSALPSRKQLPGTHWIRDWVGRRVDVNTIREEKNLPVPGIEPRPSSLYPVAILTELSRLLSTRYVFL
jgi:hypothetical protein